MVVNTIPRTSADRLKRESEFSDGSNGAEVPESDSPDDADAPDLSDGRRLRRSRNRDAVVDALLALYQDGNLDPSAADVAERSGLSPRSLFRYFDDVTDLCRAAIDRQYAILATMAQIELDSAAPLQARVEALVERRISLYKTAGKVGLVARLRAPFESLIADQLVQGRAGLRDQIEMLFHDELTGMGETRRSMALNAIDALCTFESYHLMRDNQGLDTAGLSSVLGDSILTLLGHPPA
jgi:TetR/AcrR family transcriptional regulator of autoinduction and epiphytic fitness